MIKNCVYVGNLPREYTEERLRALVESAGRSVGKVTIATDRRRGRSRGFGFVEMSTEEEAAAVLEFLSGREIEGRPLKLGTAFRPKKGTGTPRDQDESDWGPPRGGGGRGRGRR